MKTSRARCAVVGCSHDARSKGFCANHYQQMRLLKRTKRLPSGWKVDHPPSQSLMPVVLKRGKVLETTTPLSAMRRMVGEIKRPLAARNGRWSSKTSDVVEQVDDDIEARLASDEHLKEEASVVDPRAAAAMRALYPMGLGLDHYDVFLDLYTRIIGAERH